MSAACLVAAVAAALIVVPGLPAAADHTDPREPLSPLSPGHPGVGIARGLGEWEFIQNFPSNPGTDLEFFEKDGATYSSSGTLGQGDEAHVGQRILRLVTANGKVSPKWVADHGSANCFTNNPRGTTGLQHDMQVTPKGNPRLLIDATDATGRCHDPAGGGLELINISQLQKPKFKPREIHLTRHDGTSHNNTVDDKRPWIVYNSNTDTGRPWIDVLDIRTCLELNGATLAEQRTRCRPQVYRIPFKPTWTAAQNPDGSLGAEDDGTRGPTGCHDITSEGYRLYCAAINGSAVFNVKNLTTESGRVRGEPLPCKVVDGTETKAKVTNCDLTPEDGTGNDTAEIDREVYKELGSPRARGWTLVGQINHPGRDGSNTNTDVTADQGVAVSHESDPIGSGKYMFVTDERGGGVVPPGASCAQGLDNPIGNGGMHVFEIPTGGGNIDYAQTPEGDRAVFISNDVTAGATFCNIHVIEKIPGEQRVIMAWYSQGIKIVDYFIDESGRWTFDEVASFNQSEANTWTVEDFKIEDNEDGTRTYHFMASDIQRGIDILKWTGPTNRNGERADEVQAAGARTDQRANAGLVAAGLVLLPVAALLGRRRRRSEIA
jgi:hypothetical protein